MVPSKICMIVQTCIHQGFITSVGIVNDWSIGPHIYTASKRIGLKIKCLVRHVGIPAKLVIIGESIIQCSC